MFLLFAGVCPNASQKSFYTAIHWTGRRHAIYADYIAALTEGFGAQFLASGR